MDVDLLSLKWNNHRTTFLCVIRNLREKASYTDVTLACNGKFYPVHRLVLSTCSEYFSEIFEQTSCKNPVVVLKDIDCKNLEYLLDYMYIGEVNVKQNELASLVGAAECLKIKGLAVPEEDPTPTFISPSKRQSLECHSSFSPPTKKKRISKTALDLLVDKTCVNDKDSLLTSTQSLSKPNKENSEFVDTFLSIKCEPQSDDDNVPDNYTPDFNLKTKTDDITIPLENQLEGENHIVAKQENIEPQDVDLNQPGLSRLYDHELYHPDSDASTSQPQDDAMFKFPHPPVREDFKQRSEQDSFDDSDDMKEDILSPEALHDIQSSESYTLGSIEFYEAFDQSEVRIFQCSLCPYYSKRKADCKRHAKTHTGEKPFGCAHCSYKGTTKQSLRAHVWNKHKIDISS